MFKYQRLADLLKKLVHTKCQLKDLIYNHPDPKFNPAVAYSNLSLILNNYPQFEVMHASLQKRSKQHTITNKYLLYVLVAEYLNVGAIKGGGKLKKIIMENLALLPQVQTKSKINKSSVQIRLRTLAQNQQSSKWNQILSSYAPVPVVPGMHHLSYQQYSQLVAEHPDIRNSPACVVQSWSSALPPVFLFAGLITQQNECRKCDIIDACSAPGNKTLQLGEFLSQRGTVFAFEKNERRYGTLCKNIERYNAKNISPLLQSFLEVDPNDPKYKKVKLILLDPSCSGSGMLTNFTRDGSTDQPDSSLSFQEFVAAKFQKLPDKEKQRVLQLQTFQLQLLTHAARFSPQRISYSTCSIYKQENEEVVRQFLQSHPQFYLARLPCQSVEMLQPGFGNKYQRCVRVDPRSRKSDGFFVCVFKRRKLQHNL